MSKNGSSTGTAPKKASRRPRWLGPLLEDPMYRRMRKALIREIAPDMALDWIEAEEYVMSQYQSMRFGNWQKVIWEHCKWDGIKRAVKRRLRQRCPSDPEDELDWKAGRLWPTMASSIEPAEIEAETFLARQSDLDSIARRRATALRRRDAALRHTGCSLAICSWRFLSWISSNSRTFSIAITAWSANVVTSSICLPVNGSSHERLSAITPMVAPSLRSGKISSRARRVIISRVHFAEGWSTEAPVSRRVRAAGR